MEFLNKAFASTNVQAKYEEIEAIGSGQRTASQIAADIQKSDAVFVVLGQNVENLKHTRDWVAWESGAGCAGNKDIWVLESIEDSPRLSVVIPHVRYCLSYQYTDQWLALLRSIIVSYDDSHVLKAMAAGAGIGAMLGEGAGAVIGGGAGLVLASFTQQKSRPTGFPVSCPRCHSTYNVFLSLPAMRCPVCNVQMRFQIPTQQSALPPNTR